MYKIRKAIIPAAGFGTRFLPATKSQPKEMLPLINKPAIQYIVEEAIASGIQDILIVTGRNKRAIEDHFDHNVELEYFLKEQGKWSQYEEVLEIAKMADIHFIRQKEQRGLGHAVLCSRNFVGNEPFAILLGDDIIDNPTKPALRQMMEQFETHGKTVVGVQPVLPEEVSKYGVIAGMPIDNHIYELEDLVEKPDTDKAPSNLAIVGRYIIQPEIFDILEETGPGRGGEIQLTDALKILCLKQGMHARLLEGDRHDIGDKWGYIKATLSLALRCEDLHDKLHHFWLERSKGSASK
ncbi:MULTISPECIES: UTP--glucose-1-phosphate uridylyltransferase GalU [Paenibacillus]|uniref:UTP--glucose-1-phosphate uridylyltransferase n=1 Tax=Paenibacillus naphthalenovorans TaxID=162209 RepID=A0A0U2WAH3_9BACL|nr:MULTISPECIES: UTP--glucose-1-phosphate uridylyltransferase GalU [Paenibacillus]ALS22362.1 UTP--glucose-1-phosphate uridylyltransferase [Paenibacillus naphthalenovorans]NTZ16830.1 UTP--glucose-1-phosphate uridylyltransferase GalU [Paenibacillus sp. JMULE4]GCL70154.1 UTP--glucose-1-phosphate uridylyltransferase [Paenibacillus naphthalenovorans]SDH90485.1 UTP--glucose-1-phosphate uridylyltransferase [Paenibacillus naphthalenovorans]